MEWMFVPFRRYAEFTGRSRRQEFWMFFLFQFVVYMVILAAMVVGMMATPGFGEPGAASGDPPAMFWAALAVWTLFWFATVIPNLAVQARRMHDQNLSGWFVVLFMFLIVFLSIVGWIVLAIFMCIDGNRGPNKYGDDPKDPSSVGDIFA